MKKEEYEDKLEKLKKLSQKESEEGNFQAVKGEIDDREEIMKDIQLHNGFDIDCGLKGSKLSGGQK